ncbi:hypothetical protein BDR26DRAFT_918168 [Obelidium mucronatum]|nr:hypothetical protein BDR26DRAFT_918168 [Obelidium mucronatum]
MAATSKEAFLALVNSGSLEAARACLAAEPSLATEASALHAAASGNDGRMVRLLRDSGADVCATAAPAHNSALHVAAMAGAADAAAVLVGAETARLCNAWRETPLHCAAAGGHVALVRLLAPHSDLAATDKWGRTPARVAREHGYEEAWELCGGAAAAGPEDPEQSVPLRSNALAALTNELLAVLGDRQIDSGKTVVVQTIFTTQTESLSGTVAAFTPPPPAPPATAPPPPPPPASAPPPPLPPSTPISSLPNKIPLLKPTPKPVKPQQSPPAPRKPINHKPNPLSSLGTPLKSIASHIEYPGSLQTLEQMLQARDVYYPQGRDMFGWTALHKFASWNDAILVERMLEVLDDASVNDGDGNQDGFTPLHCALDAGALESVKSLVKSGRCDTGSQKDAKGRTCLDLATELGLQQLLLANPSV